MSDVKMGQVAQGVFLGLLLFFVVLPIATCTGCTALMTLVAQ